jgi:hypothetical protein
LYGYFQAKGSLVLRFGWTFVNGDHALKIVPIQAGEIRVVVILMRLFGKAEKRGQGCDLPSFCPGILEYCSLKAVKQNLPVELSQIVHSSGI